jgi:hypothetical protein
MARSRSISCWKMPSSLSKSRGRLMSQTLVVLSISKNSLWFFRNFPKAAVALSYALPNTLGLSSKFWICLTNTSFYTQPCTI